MPGNIVGAIANEADISGKSIGRINIYDDFTLIDLPAGMPNETLSALKKIWVAGQKLGITRLGDKEKDTPLAKARPRPMGEGGIGGSQARGGSGKSRRPAQAAHH